MRALLLAGFLAVLLPSLAHGQTTTELADQTFSTLQPLHITPGATSTSQVPLGPTSSCQSSRCGSKKGALIGMSIGAGLAIWGSSYCDGANNCGWHRLGAVAVLAGLGAGIGAIVGPPNRTNPIAFPADTRVAVAPMVSRRGAGGAMAVRF